MKDAKEGGRVGVLRSVRVKFGLKGLLAGSREIGMALDGGGE
jgi:hypothetical protein